MTSRKEAAAGWLRNVCKPSLQIGDRVMARMTAGKRGRSIRDCVVVDVVVGFYFANSEIELDYMVRDADYLYQWVSPDQIVSRRTDGSWVEFHEEAEL